MRLKKVTEQEAPQEPRSQSWEEGLHGAHTAGNVFMSTLLASDFLSCFQCPLCRSWWPWGEDRFMRHAHPVPLHSQECLGDGDGIRM